MLYINNYLSTNYRLVYMQLLTNLRRISYNLILWMFYFFFDSIVILKKNKNTKNNEKIVVVKVDRIGDFILWIDSAINLRKKNSKKKITLIVNDDNYKLASYLNIFDEIIPISIPKLKKNLFYRFNILNQISKKNYDIVYHPTYSRIFFTGDSIIRVINASQKIGFQGDNLNQTQIQKNISDNWYTKLIRVKINSYTELEFHRDFVTNTYDRNFKNRLPKINVKKSNKIIFKKKFFICIPLSSKKNKNWSLKKFKNVIEKISIKKSIIPVLVGSKSDAKLINQLKKNLVVNNLDLSGKTTLLDLFDLIKRAEFVVGVDSGPMHIAPIMKTNSFVIIENYFTQDRFFPYKIDYNTKDKMPILIKASKGRKISDISEKKVIKIILNNC